MKNSWDTAPLGEVAPKSDAPMPAATSKVWNLSLEDVEANTGRILKRVETIVSELGSAKCSFDSRHVLYSKLRPYLNKVVLPDSAGVGTSELIPLLPDTSRLCRDFLAWYLRSPIFLNFSKTNTRGANLPRVAMKALWEHEVPVPPLNEQCRIVGRIQDAIGHIAEIRILHNQRVEELVEIKRSLVLGVVPDNQKRLSLGELVDWISETEPVTDTEQYKFAGVKSFGCGLFHSATRTKSDFKYPSVRRLRQGDFTYPKLMAWEGAFGMVPNQLDGFVVSPEFVVFRPKETATICVEVLDTYFRSPFCLDDVRKASTGTNKRRRRLNPKAFLNLEVPVPSQEQQEKLRAVYHFADRAELEWQELQARLDVLQSAILYKAFSGDF